MAIPSILALCISWRILLTSVCSLRLDALSFSSACCKSLHCCGTTLTLVAGFLRHDLLPPPMSFKTKSCFNATDGGNVRETRQRPYHAGEIWKRGFISTVSPSNRNQTFRKRSSNRRNLKTTALRFRVDGKHFEDRAFQKRWRHDNHVISLTEFSSNTDPKLPVIVFLYFSGAVWTKNISCVFRVKSVISNSPGEVWMALNFCYGIQE